MEPPPYDGQGLIVEQAIEDNLGYNNDGNIDKVIANENGSQQALWLISEVNDALANAFLFFQGPQF